ncbi:MAG: trimethylamine methyltransferase family protein [bacterium]|nr:trimethylamine methyltransferase family protein [bacterium]
MAYNWFTQNPLKVFSDESVQKIHTSVICLLEKVGVCIDSEEALILLREYGIRCDLKKMRAYPDEKSIQRALKTVQKGYKLYSRKFNEQQMLNIDLTTTHTISGGAALKLYSRGKYTDATKNDLVDMIVLHEKLDNINMLINVVEPTDMKDENIYPKIAAELFCYSSKPLLLQVSGGIDLKKIIRMASLLVDGEDKLKKRPIFMTGINSEPPLKITKEGAEVLICAAKASIPVSLGAYLMAGATGPLDVVASIIQRTATVLTGLVLTQAAQPGSIYDFTCHSGSCDLKTGDVITMSPQVMQIVAGSIQIGRYYGLITHSLAATEANAPDAQASGERFFSLIISVMAGASVIHHTTSCMAGMELADFAQCVIDNEIAGYVLDFAKGISMDTLDEAVRVIKDVIEDPQYSALSFLGHPHTVKYCRKQTYKPKLFSIGMLSRWMAGERQSLYEKAEKKVGKLLAERQEFIPQDVKQKLFKLALEESSH